MVGSVVRERPDTQAERSVAVVRDALAARTGYARVNGGDIGFESKQKWEIARWAGKAWQVRRAYERVPCELAGGEVVTADRGA